MFDRHRKLVKKKTFETEERPLVKKIEIKTGNEKKDKEPLSHDWNCTVEKGVLYKDPNKWDAEFSKLDLFYRKGEEKKQVVVYIHGGRWVEGDKSQIEKSPNLIKFFLDQEYIVASINFRLLKTDSLPAVTYRHQAEDIALAIKWLTENIENYGGLNSQFILYGFSSGAHLSSLIATDPSYLKQAGLPVHCIRAVVGLDVPAYDIPLALTLMKGTALEINIPFNEKAFGRTRKEQMRGSPAYFAFNSKMPFLLVSSGLHKGKPQSVTHDVTESFKKVLLKSGHHALHVHYKNRTHRSLLYSFGNKDDDLNAHLAGFLKEINEENSAPEDPLAKLLRSRS